jgi:hypothetical protein
MYIGILTSVAREEHLIPQLEYHLIFGKLLWLEVIVVNPPRCLAIKGIVHINEQRWQILMKNDEDKGKK